MLFFNENPTSIEGFHTIHILARIQMALQKDCNDFVNIMKMQNGDFFVTHKKFPPPPPTPCSVALRSLSRGHFYQHF